MRAPMSGEVFVSSDGGQTWTRTAIGGLAAGARVWAIAPSPSNCNDVMVAVGLRGHLVNGQVGLASGPRLFRKTDFLGPPDGWPLPGALPQAPLYAIVRSPSSPGTKLGLSRAMWASSGPATAACTGRMRRLRWPAKHARAGPAPLRG